MSRRPGKRPGGRTRHACGLLAARAVLGALVVLVAAIAMIPAAPAMAGEVPTSPGIGLAVSPPRLVVPAGQDTKVQRLEVENRGLVPIQLIVRKSALGEGPDGSAVIGADATYSAANWVTIVPGTLRIMPGTTRFVQIRIQLPAHPESGDHEVEIIFLAPPVAGKGNIHVAEGLGVPVLITVPGPVIDQVSVTRLTASGFSSGGTIPLTATVHESGDVHHSFRGPGQQLTADAAGTQIEFPPFTLLRGSSVSATAYWSNPPAMCICHVTVSVVTDGHRSTASVTIIRFPVVKAIGGACVLIVLALAFMLARRHLRKRLKAAYQAGRMESGAEHDKVS